MTFRKQIASLLGLIGVIAAGNSGVWVLRGGGYTTTGGDIRITSRSKMMPDFRDETIGFRCAISGS